MRFICVTFTNMFYTDTNYYIILIVKRDRYKSVSPFWRVTAGDSNTLTPRVKWTLLFTDIAVFL